MLTRTTVAGYGAAEAGILAVELLLRIHILKYYTDTFGLPPHLAGAAMAFAVIWDAVTDPIMGRLSDRTKGRFGRRRPYIALGAPLLAVAAVLLVAPPTIALGTNLGLAMTLGVTAAFANTALTILGVPHAAWAAELSDDSHVRTKLFASRLLWGNLGLLVGTMAPGLMLQWMGEPALGTARYRTAYTIGAMVIGCVVLVGATVTLLFTSEGDAGPRAEPKSNHRRARSVLKNAAFTRLIVAYSVATIGIGINGTLSLFYYERVVKLAASGVNAVYGLFVLAWTVSVPAWVVISRRIGKRRSGTIGVVGLGLLTAVIYPFLPPGNLTYPLMMALATGLLMGSIVVLDATLADLIEYDEALTGVRRDGEFFGVWKFCGKAARAAAILATGLLLTTNGQLQASRSVIAWSFGAGVGFFLVAGGLIFATIPYGERKRARVAAIIARRRGAL